MEQVKTAVNSACRFVISIFVQGSPPELYDEVQDLLDSLSMAKRHQLVMYNYFHMLAQLEEEEIVHTATEIPAEAVYELIVTRRRWCEKILRRIIELGGQEEEKIGWNEYLYILLRFCSLSRVELCQVLFMVIVKESDSQVKQYLTMAQLSEFYSFYARCPVTSFNTRAIDFSRLPLRRYYVADFTELVMRFTVLLNPMLHLQRTLMEYLPSIDFWNSHHRQDVHARRINEEFFVIDKSRCYIWGEPPFRETCEMLAPEALGVEPINQAQWNMRTFDLHERIGALSDATSINLKDGMMAPPGYQYRSLRHFSVWGEQPNPEETEAMMLDQDSNAYMTASGYITKSAKEEDDGDPKKKKKKKKGRVVLDEVKGPLEDPELWSKAAAAQDETYFPPADVLPPIWMKHHTVAPAPRRRTDDPPLALDEVPFGITTYGSSQWGDTPHTSLTDFRNTQKQQSQVKFKDAKFMTTASDDIR